MEQFKRIFILLTVLLLSSCSMLGNYMDPQNPAPEYYINGQLVKVSYVPLTPTWIIQHNTIPTYRVGPYDILNIIVWDHPELTTITTQLSSAAQSGFLVSDQGTIAFPFAGTVFVSGLTLPQIQTLIAQKISKYIRNPQVTALVVAFRSQEAQIMGEVGVRTIPLSDKPTTLLDAIVGSGGTNVLSSDTSRIYIIRGTVQRLTVFALNAKSPQTMMLAQHFNLRNNDIVYVAPLAITNWDRWLGQVLLFGSAVKGTAALAQ